MLSGDQIGRSHQQESQTLYEHVDALAGARSTRPDHCSVYGRSQRHVKLFIKACPSDCYTSVIKSE